MQEKGILCAKLVVAVEFVQEKDVLCTKMLECSGKIA